MILDHVCMSVKNGNKDMCVIKVKQNREMDIKIASVVTGA